MTTPVVILDFSVYGNPYDPCSDALLAEAIERQGGAPTIVGWAPDRPWSSAPARVWLRYDLRSQGDFDWTVAEAGRLEEAGHRVFPSRRTIAAAEDKWLTTRALTDAGLPIPLTLPGDQAHRLPLPLILKPRVGWGARGTTVIDQESADRLAVHASATAVAQPFLPHERTLILAMAGGRLLACIEDLGGGLRPEGRVGTIPPPRGAAEISTRALAATGLIAGTVDLLETPDGLLVLEVNSAPRLTYPHLPEVDLAGPMVAAVLAEWGRA